MDFGEFTMAPSSSAEVELDRKLYTMLDLEMKRYQNFFATLDEHQQRLLPRDTALAFYGKSSLSEQEILGMYDLIKSLQLHSDASVMNETEFITGMHFIVCITKRNLAKLPPTFPKYLFPTLDLTPSSATFASNSISSMPSPDKDDMAGGFAGIRLNDNATVTVTSSSPSSSLEAPGQMQPLQDAKSLSQLLEKEIHNKRVEATALSKVDESESKALQSLRGCLDLIAENVEKLGFPVPTTARSLEALDDFSNLLRNHVQTMKQEIQSMEISAQMLSVASEASSGTSDARRESEDPFKEIAALTQQLLALQHQATQLYQKRETLAKQVDEAKSKKVQQQQAAPSAANTMDACGATPPTSVPTPVEMQTSHHVGITSPTTSHGSATADGWGDLGLSNAHEVRSSESVQRSDSNPFGAFGGSASPVTSAPPASSNDDFNWGSFS
ncbi:Ef-hand domain pair, partial [Globisporangium splendens]